MKKDKETGKEKTATNNQWISTGLVRPTDKKVRKDGPGGEDAK